MNARTQVIHSHTAPVPRASRPAVEEAIYLRNSACHGTLAVVPGKKQFEQQIAALDALRHAPESARLDPLRKALTHKNNFIAGKAADLAREFNLQELTPDLLKAFDRYFVHAEKSDPQCWAKNAISRALAAFEFQEPAVFLRGMHHIQLEPVWGGLSDTAGRLRATCALALVQCRALQEPDLLAHLINLFADKDKAVRTEVARAIEQVGSPSAALLLRLRATLANDQPEVLGACYSGVLRLEGKNAVPWVAGFLASADDAAAEAALAIAGSHSVEGFEVLRDQLKETSDPWFRSILLSAIALTRQESATDYLLHLVQTESLNAEGAIEAILRSMPSSEVLDRLEKAANTNPRLAHAFRSLRNP